jgi:hypothetical protein
MATGALAQDPASGQVPRLDEVRASVEARESSTFPLTASYVLRYRARGSPADGPEVEPPVQETLWIDPPKLAYILRPADGVDGMEVRNYFDGARTISGTRTGAGQPWTITVQSKYSTVFEQAAIWRYLMAGPSPVGPMLFDGNAAVLGTQEVDGRRLVSVRVRKSGLWLILDLDPELGAFPRRATLALEEDPIGAFAAYPKLTFTPLGGERCEYIQLSTTRIGELQQTASGVRVPTLIEPEYTPPRGLSFSARLVDDPRFKPPVSFELVDLFEGEGRWEDLDRLELHYLGESPKLRAEAAARMSAASASTTGLEPPGSGAKRSHWTYLVAGGLLVVGASWILVRAIRARKRGA